MNRKQWETEQNCGDFIKGDIQYCRNKAESFEEFIFLMEKLGYEVNVGAHISVKAEGMRRSRRLDTLDEEFSVRNLQNYYEQERPYKYVEPPVYHLGYALHKKPANAFQQRYYGKVSYVCGAEMPISVQVHKVSAGPYPYEGVAGGVYFLKT